MSKLYLPDEQGGSFYRIMSPMLVEKHLRNFGATLMGFVADDDVNSIELTYVMDWYEEHKVLASKQPYKQLYQMLDAAFEDGNLSVEEVKDMVWYIDGYTNHESARYCYLTTGLQYLIGMVDGMICDGLLSIDDLEHLVNWMHQHEHLKNLWPYDELYSLLLKVTHDGMLSQEEHDEVMAFGQYLVTSKNPDGSEQVVGGFLQVDPNIIFENRNFCFTGNSKRKKRREIEALVKGFGGKVLSVTSNLDYLVVCDGESMYWAYTCYGRKIEQAIQLRKLGAKLVIVGEVDFWDAVEGKL